MKKYLKNLLLAAMMAFVPSLSINCFAQDPGGGNGGGNGTGGDDPNLIPIKSTPDTSNPPRFLPGDYDDIPIIPIPQPNPGHEPRNRNAVQSPRCYHADGIVYIEADTTVTYITATVTRYDDNHAWPNSAASNNLEIEASPDPGTYRLDLTLSNGQSYFGEYLIE